MSSNSKSKKKILWAKIKLSHLLFFKIFCVYLHDFFVIDKSGNKNIYKLSGLTIGTGVDSATVFISLVLIAIFLTKRFKHRRARKLKQKFSELNRGQLPKQLVSQRADIGERMIITLDELDKATNNFDKARELGGGGHGTVYKGILSDLHVVAIKKSNIAGPKGNK